jgi:hypothetical protein
MFVGRYVLALVVAITALASGCKDEGTTKFVPERQGSRGESCLITNDCKSGLLCIANTCIADDFALEPTSKVCVLAQCVDASDCCRQSPSLIASCKNWEMQCANNPNSFSCNTFAQNCGACTSTCTDHSCVSTEVTEPECLADIDCPSSQKCVAGECSNCGTDAECGMGNVCTRGQCVAGCLRDEACGALAKCNVGRCEDRGCVSNRECVAFMERPDAVCGMDGKCSIPCEDNAGCASLGGLYSCKAGSCTYVGCDSSAECAAAADGAGAGLRLCLEQAEADKVKFGGGGINF